MDDLHVIPCDDLREHDSSELCWCAPVRDDDEPRVVIHNAMDGRETWQSRVTWSCIVLATLVACYFAWQFAR